MKDHLIVCPFDDRLLSKLNRKAIVIKTNDLNIISYIENRVNKNNHLHAILLQLDQPLSDITFQEEWKDIPLAIYAPELGIYRKTLTQVQLLKHMNLKIFLNAEIDINYTSLKILSSLQIACGISFKNGSIKWDMISDLLHYAIYSKIPHAPIEPIDYIATHYKHDDFTDFSSVYFENFRSYVHIDREGNVALSSDELDSNNFISCNINSLDNIHNTREYKDRSTSWQTYFLGNKACAYCPAWRICLGKFHVNNPDGLECRSFFSEVMDAVDFYRLKENTTRKNLWQS